MSDTSGRRIVRSSDVETMLFDWGAIKWMSEPRVTDAQRFTMGVVLLEPGKGHARHNHPGCEEVLYIISGSGNQMIDLDGEQWHAISAGDLVHIPADIFHATMNTGWEPLKMIAVYSPPGPEAILRDLPDCKLIPAGESPNRS
jgi:oxalate decarboxylase/phosphoglucose isomerase-like protein (cupin superfamily)